MMTCETKHIFEYSASRNPKSIARNYREIISTAQVTPYLHRSHSYNCAFHKKNLCRFFA